MAYSNNKPQATDRISASQGVLLDDFIAIDTGWKVNHVDLNLPNTGKHHYVTLPNNTFGAAFPYETLANEVALYAESGNLYFRPAGQAVGVHTNDINFNDATGNIATGWYKFPNGLIIKWGNSGSEHGAGNYTITLSALPAITTVLAVSLTPINSDTQAIISYGGFDVANQRVTWSYGRSFKPDPAINAACKCIILGI